MYSYTGQSIDQAHCVVTNNHIRARMLQATLFIWSSHFFPLISITAAQHQFPNRVVATQNWPSTSCFKQHLYWPTWYSTFHVSLSFVVSSPKRLSRCGYEYLPNERIWIFLERNYVWIPKTESVMWIWISVIFWLDYKLSCYCMPSLLVWVSH